MTSREPPLPWLEAGQNFPATSQAWGADTPAPGLLAAGGTLDVATLRQAYAQGIFPWFSSGQPVLWWSTDPRMVLAPAQFRLHRSLRKTLQRFVIDPRCELRFNSAFDQVIQACSGAERPGQSGTWIVPSMVQAYQAMHRAGWAYSVETWIDGQLAAGLYGVCIGRAIFGESMFTRQPDASKIALAGLVAFCRAHQIQWIDCQQNTSHLASLGARPIPRSQFVDYVAQQVQQPALPWHFDSVYWQQLLTHKP